MRHKQKRPVAWRRLVSLDKVNADGVLFWVNSIIAELYTSVIRQFDRYVP